MYADNEFLICLSEKLFEIAENTIDLDTKNELLELAQISMLACE